ncbi:hypothetical protein COW46_03685 [Candidatus Gracilibacteria bacterium CG17_big_fil_post_rev_8_21_14_2_50_48_13]|nr:MAG: hypothetical protein COW46_03685 [Candidatus Gracilibacteria bacterium CG17_big_fil_post_rev_8_21_14_2_50_48_13]
MITPQEDPKEKGPFSAATEAFKNRLRSLRFSGADLSPLARAYLRQEETIIEEVTSAMQRWISHIVDDAWEATVQKSYSKESYHVQRQIYAPNRPYGKEIAWSNGARIERFRGPTLQGTGLTHPGISYRKPWEEKHAAETPNEDNFALMPEYNVFAVCDGVGGTDAGAMASHVVLEEIRRHAGGLIDGMKAANHRLGAMPFSAETTVAAVEITSDGELYPLWVGDSRILVLTDKNELCFRSHDHGAPAVLADKELQEDLDYEDRYLISESVGYGKGPMRTSLETNPSDFFVQLHPGYTVLLLTDGVLDSMNSYDIASFFQQHPYVPKDRWAEFLAVEMHERMARVQFTEYALLGGLRARKLDNFSIVVLEYLG